MEFRKEVYIEQLEGFVLKCEEHKVYQFKKDFYGSM